MAKVRQRSWTVPGQRTKHRAWGYVTIENGKQVRQFRADWTEQQAQEALAKHLLKIERPRAKGDGITFGEAVARYLEAKARKRSLAEDARILGHLKEHFGEDTPLADVTASRIAEYKGARLSAVRKIGEGET